ncbi:hypothetical protein FACS1894164_10980 [Spirochaetia bacterium]|nr:hypothetical protein FACS1894164_10980 [Spirochaetia bacterium]
MNISGEVTTYLANTITLYAPITQEIFIGEKPDEIMCKNDPATFKETAYFDGSSIGVARFSYWAKSKNADKARTQLEKILAVLDFPDLEISDGLFIKCEPRTQVMFMYEVEGDFVYTCTISLEFERN